MDEFHNQNLSNCCGHEYDQLILQKFLFNFSEFSSDGFFLPFGRGVRLLLFLLLGLDFLCVPTRIPKKIGTLGGPCPTLWGAAAWFGRGAVWGAFSTPMLSALAAWCFLLMIGGERDNFRQKSDGMEKVICSTAVVAGTVVRLWLLGRFIFATTKTRLMLSHAATLLARVLDLYETYCFPRLPIHYAPSKYEKCLHYQLP